jgi:hypothetical protein
LTINIGKYVRNAHINELIKCSIENFSKGGGLGLWCLMPLSTIFQFLLVEEARENHRPAASHCKIPAYIAESFSQFFLSC